MLDSLRLERDEVKSKGEVLEANLSRIQAVESQSALTLKEDLQKREEEKETLIDLNKALKNDISRAQSELR